jgi:hypothetical protein
MALLRGLIHLAALIGIAALALAFGRWLRQPDLQGALPLVVLAIVMGAAVWRLYGRGGMFGPPARTARRGPERPREVEAELPPAVTLIEPEVEPEPDPAEHLWLDEVEEEDELHEVVVVVEEEIAATGIDLNRASLAELRTLPGVGPVVATRIVEARPFGSVDDLAGVPGFGPARVRALRDLVRV